MFFLRPKSDINAEVERFKSTPGAVLLDVRSPEECLRGKIPGSINLPLNNIHEAGKFIPDKSAHVFVFCQHGGRAKRAVGKLRRMGYPNAVSIGGYSNYKG